jgi:hypothetical protein
MASVPNPDYYSVATANGASGAKFATAGVGSTNFSMWHDAPQFALGYVTHGTQNSVWRYVKASVALPVGPCAVSAANVASAGAGFKIQGPALANQYGFAEFAAGAT